MCSSITIKFKRIRHIDIYTLKYNFIAPDKTLVQDFAWNEILALGRLL